MNSLEVLSDILQQAQLTEPCSAMSLWKYPVSDQHLRDLLREFVALGAVPSRVSRERQGALALLVAHLACEHLKAGSWRWEPVLTALSWNPTQAEMQRLREHVGDGLEFYWKRPVRLVGGDREYLGSLLVEGGLPLCWLTGEGGPRVQQLLQRLMRLVERHRVSALSFVGEHVMVLPATLQNEPHVAELLAGMADLLVQLRRRLPAGCESPVEYLDAADPGWRQRLPIPRTRMGGIDRLISQLLAAESETESESESPLLTLNWRLNVTEDRVARDVILAKRISTSALARELLRPDEGLPSLLYLCLESRAGRRIQLARLERGPDSNTYVVVQTGTSPRITDLDEWRGTVFANRAQYGQFLPSGGEVLEPAVPWVFDDYERGSHLLLTSGNCELRSETLIVSVPGNAHVVAGSAGIVEALSDLNALGRHHYRVRGAAQITIDREAYVVASSEPNALGPIRLRVHGARLWLGALGSAPLLGTPRVTAESDDVAHDVPSSELEWRPNNGFGRWRNWRDEPVIGDASIRWRKGGRTHARLRTIVVPSDFAATSLSARTVNSLRLAAASLEDVVIADESPVTVGARGSGEFWISPTETRPTSSVLTALLRFSDGCATELRLPLPSSVTGFVEPNGCWLPTGARRSLTRCDALRARGAGYAEFQLDARCEGSSWELVATVKAGTSGWAELPLDTVREQLESMLSSTNLDGTVELRFSPLGRIGADSPRLSLANYGLSIEFDVKRGQGGEPVSFDCRVCAQDDHAHASMLGTTPVLKAIALASPWVPWTPLARHDANLFRLDVHGYRPGPHLVVAFHGELLQTRPKLVVIPGPVDTSVSSIAALASEPDYGRRAQQWRVLIGNMSRDFWHVGWADTSKLIEITGALPPATFELLRSLAGAPDACAMLLLRQPTVDHQRVVLRLLAQLGVLPETIPLPAWLRALRRVVEAFRSKPALIGAFGGIASALSSAARASFGTQPSSVLELTDLLRCFAARHVPDLPRGAQDYTAVPFTTLRQYLHQQWQVLLSRHTDDQWPQSPLDVSTERTELPIFECNGYQRSIQLAPLYTAVATFRGDVFSPRNIRQLHQLKSFDRDWFAMAHLIHLTVLAQRHPAEIKGYLNDV